MIINGAFSLLSVGIHMVAMCLVLAAVYADREASQRIPALGDAGGGEYQPSSNPYAPPRKD